MGGLSALTVVPQVPFLRLACCVWAIVGGALAGYLVVKNSPTRVGVGEGAIVGTLAGIVGTIISLVAFLLVSYYITDRSAAEDQIEHAGFHISYSQIILLICLLTLFIQVALSLVGGIVGVALFEQREEVTGTAAPAPPQFGGPTDESPAPPPAPPDS